MMQHIKMWKWILTSWVFLAPVFVQVDRAETRLDSLDRSIVHRVDGPAQPDETRESSSWQIVGQVGGPTEDVAVQGNYAYVGVGLRLVVLDVSDPTTPQEIGSTTPFPQFVEGVAVSSTVACVVIGPAGLRIIDVSDPAHPVEVGAFDTPGYAEGVAVAGQYAYVADGPYGLRVVDISDSAHPAEVAYAYPLNYAFDVATDGQYIYLAAAGAGLLVVDISDPPHPTEMGTYDTPGYAYGVDAAGDLAYVADGWEGLRVVDVSDPAHPAEVSSYDTPGWAFGVDVVGSLSYVADAFAGLRVLEVSDPMQPAELGGYEVLGGHAGRVAVLGDTAYVADRNWGLRVLSVSDPVHPAQIGFYNSLGYADAVAVSGNYAYVAAGLGGLRVVDISDLTHPRQVGIYDTGSYATSIVVSGTYAYVAVAPNIPEYAGLRVVDVSDPASPTGVGFYQFGAGAARDLAVTNGMAYLTDEWGLRLISVSNPFSPTETGYIDLHGEGLGATVGVAISGSLAYVAASFAGLKIVDVSNSSAPTVTSVYTGADFTWDVAVAANRAYVASHGYGLYIVDVSDPLHPSGLGSYGLPGSEAYEVAVAGSTAYLAKGRGGVWAVDVSNPITPTLAGTYNTAGSAQAVTVRDNHLYVADGSGGLLILEKSFSPLSGEERPMNLDAGLQRHSPPVSPPIPRWLRPRTLLSTSRQSQYPSQTDKQGTWRPTLAPAQETNHIGHGLTTCVVTSTADTGIGTLRWCLENAASGDTITFDSSIFPPTCPVTITLNSGLPDLTQGDLTIDASQAGVILDGRNAPPYTSGLVIGSDGNIIRGLQILYFPNGGVDLKTGAKNNVIGGDRTIGSGLMGQGNLISGNGGPGVNMYGSDVMSNTIIGNLIGTDTSGMSALGNQDHGVFVFDARHNRIGGTLSGERNLISDNRGCGISIQRVHATGNQVIGNFIGTTITGTGNLGNAAKGVCIELGAFNNRVEQNVISSNGQEGILIADWGSDYNVVVGNLIGTDVSGTMALGNSWGGIQLGQFERFNRVGGTAAGEGNLISGNISGVSLYNSDDLILGNFIGTNISGTATLSKTGEGIDIAGPHNFIGGTTPAERNVISSNGFKAVNVSGPGTEYNFIGGNFIGTDVSGAVALGGSGTGVTLDTTEHNFIQNNLISGNQGNGVELNTDARFNHLRANRIGTAADGTSPLPNGMAGVRIEAASNTVGGPYPEDGNIIAFNAGDGVRVSTYFGNTITQNSIFSNDGLGIDLTNGANGGIAAPVIFTTTLGSVNIVGTACASCTVEVFENSDTDGEGENYVGDTTATASGAFTVTVSYLTKPYLTATATDAFSGTSEFSAVFTSPMAGGRNLYLPIILKLYVTP